MQLNSITLDDIAFNPVSQDGNVQVLKASGTSYALSQTLTIKSKKVQANTKTRTVQILVDLPEAFTDLNDRKSVIRATMSCLCTIPVNLTAAGVTQLRTQMAQALSNAIIVDAIDNGAIPY